MRLTLSSFTEYSRQLMQFRSVCDAWLPTLRCVAQPPKQGRGERGIVD